MNRLGKWGEFRNEIRWTVVVVVLATLAVVALWPRDTAPNAPEAGSPGAQGPPPAAAEQPVDPARRAAAELERCRQPGDQGATGLAGAVGTCMADGSTAELADALGGRPALINVWATWCAPCREELPALQTYSEQPGAIDVIGVQVRSGQADGIELLDELDVHYPNLHDGENRIKEALPATNVLPASFIVTAEGEVRRIDPPIAFGSPDEVRAAVRDTLEGRE
ncbi:TlpA family protein disulfide reductase [Parasphingorhabdus pacifica]